EVFDFAYEKTIPVLKGLADELGEERFLEAVKKVASECALKAGQETARKLPCNDLAAFTGAGEEPSRFAEHVLTRETVEDTPQAFELRVTECLWAKTFREMGAADLGYLLLCHTDYADCRGFNPKITLTRSKTLMQGDDCCDHRFVWKA
ncbi:L-2-amino-thiazoline-4-carboxylic acid hydrolase, partial [Candidatus Bipolaricaulota bacterium]